jgi:hypothetical protein
MNYDDEEQPFLLDMIMHEPTFARNDQREKEKLDKNDPKKPEKQPINSRFKSKKNRKLILKMKLKKKQENSKTNI